MAACAGFLAGSSPGASWSLPTTISPPFGAAVVGWAAAVVGAAAAAVGAVVGAAAAAGTLVFAGFGAAVGAAAAVGGASGARAQARTNVRRRMVSAGPT